MAVSSNETRIKMLTSTRESDALCSRHVFQDLMAYTCTFNHCDHGPFGSRTAWAILEQRQHLRSWRCPICHDEFDTQTHTVEHVVAAHPSLDRALLDDLIHAASPPIERVPISQCPFCDDQHLWKGVLEHYSASTSQSKSQDQRSVLDESVSVSLYHRHMSRHMEQLALFAVPAAARDDDDEDSDTGDRFDQIVTGQTDKDDVSTTSIETVSEHNSFWKDDEDTNEEMSITRPNIDKPGNTEVNMKPRRTQKISLPLIRSNQEPTPGVDEDAIKFSDRRRPVG